MNPAADLYRHAAKLGLRLEPRGEWLAVIPGPRCPPDFADELRQHKSELLAFLEAKAANLTPDCAPWLPTARQILAGEFDGADGSTVQSLVIGLRSIRHPACQRALAWLHDHKPESTSPDEATHQ
jgi:hypothetical protein